MDTNTLANKAREMLKNRYDAMKDMDMGGSDLDILKTDFVQQLKATAPGVTTAEIEELYAAMKESGDIKLETNDMLTFKKRAAK